MTSPPRGAKLVGRVVAAAFVLISPILAFAGPASASTPINGGGSGFAGLEIQQWQADVNSPAHGNLVVNFSSQSSGIGRTYFASNTWDYAASDIRYIPGIEQGTENELQSGRCGGRPLPACFKYVPVSAGALGFMYNLQNADGSRFTSLKLTPANVCDIFTGQLTSWGQLAANNPSLAGSTQPISPVVRQDEAGESYVLSEYCIAEDPADWKTFVHFQNTAACTAGLDYSSVDGPSFAANPPQPIAIWPSELEGCRAATVANGSEGVADTVHDPTEGAGAITYDAAGYALVRQLPNALVENDAGIFTAPESQSVTIALEYASAVGDGTFNLDFLERSGADPRAYNPSTYSYILAQTGGFDAGRGSTLGQFLCYAIGTGQVRAPALLYASLSAQVEAIGKAAIVQIPGAPSASQCLAGAPPPPPPPPLQKVKPVVQPVTSPTPTAGPGATGSSTGANGTSSGGTTAANGTSTAAGKSGASGLCTAGRTKPPTKRSTATTVKPGSKKASTTSTTVVSRNVLCAASNTNAGSASGIGLNPTTGLAGTTLPAPPHSTTNYDALWSVFEGAGVCALGVGLAGLRKRATA